MADGIKLFLETKDNFPFGDLKFYFGIVGKRGNHYFSIPNYVNDADYFIIHYADSALTDDPIGILPPELTIAKKGKANKYEFRDLSDWCKWIILSNLFADRPLSPNNINQSDEDLNELVRLYTEAAGKFNKNKSFITLRLTRIFEKFHEKAKSGSLEDAEVSFFKKYSKLIPDEPSTKKVRIDIIKQEGDSDYIFQNFGIKGAYSLESFSDRVTQIIRDVIDTGAITSFEFAPEEVKKKSSGDWLFKYLGESWFTFNSLGGGVTLAAGSSSGLVAGAAGVATAGIAATTAGVGLSVGAVIAVGNYLNNNTGYIEVPIKMKISQKVGLSFSRLYAKTLNLKELKDSEIYNRPTNLDEIFWSDGPGQSNSFFQNVPVTVKGDGVQDSRTVYLADVYDPSVEKDKIPFFDGTKGTGTDDVTFSYYLAFIDFIRFDIGNNAKLRQSIGYYFDELAELAADYIFKRLKTVYENTVRTIIAVTLSEKEEEILEGKVTDNELLLAAEEEAKRNLQNVDTSSIFSEDPSDEDISDREKKYKQCVLLLNLPTLKADFNKEILSKKEKKTKMHAKGLYNKRFTMLEDRSNTDDQNGLINKLITPKAEKIRPFLNMTNELYAALVPKIRLFKIYYDPSEGKKNPYLTREIPFKSHTSTKRVEMLSKPNTFDKGDGYGIKSFNFSFDGETPATSTKFIKAKLELYFQTFSDFSREREVTIEDDTYKFRYVDLFVNTKFCPRQGANEGANTNSPLHYDPSHYRIRADVGWEFPGSNVNSIMKRPGVVDGKEQLKKALETINKSFYLNLIDHDISIADDGSVTISAEYIAYIEGATGTKIMNALLSREARKLEQKQLKIYEQALADNSCDEKQLSEFRAAIGGARNIGRQKMYQSLTEKLILNDCMYSCFVNKIDRKSISRESFFYKTPKLKSIPKADAQSKEEVVKKVKSEIPDGKTQEEKWSYIVSNHLADPDPSLGTKINFFYFADLVYFLMDSLYEEDHSTTFFPEVENIKVILTSFSLSLLGENNKLLTNIGQIPVDLDTFIDWYKGEILDKKIEAISIIDFIKRFFLYLIKDIFQEVCVNTGQHKRLSFKTMSLMAYGKKKGKVEDPLYALLKKELEIKDNNNPIMNAASHYSAGKLPLSTSSFDQNKAESSDFFNYMVIFVHYRPDNFVGLGVKSDDESRGVYHFFIGADKGLVKKINFSKSDIQYIRESRMMNQGSNNLLQLSSAYRCSMTMIGNTLLYPGMEIFVNPFGFGGPEFGQPNDGPGTVDIPNLSNIMGIGGYQQVIKVNSTISPGKFETTIDALFIHSGEKKEEISSSSPRGSKPNKNRFKNFCSIEDQAIDTPKAENNVIDCNDTILDLENLLLDYSQTGNISQPEEDE